VALEAVDRAYGDEDSREIRDLRVLTGKKLGQLESSVALYGHRGSGGLVNMGTEAGRLTMDDLLKVADSMRATEAERLRTATTMDVSWLQQRLPGTEPAVEQRFRRILESLSAGVDLKRRLVEELRPTLLDNMGLFTALRWQSRRPAGVRD
jgi:hypothetical protein